MQSVGAHHYYAMHVTSVGLNYIQFFVSISCKSDSSALVVLAWYKRLGNLIGNQPCPEGTPVNVCILYAMIKKAVCCFQ